MQLMRKRCLPLRSSGHRTNLPRNAREGMKRARIILPLFLFLVGGLLVFTGLWSPAPESFDHQGRSVEAWVADLRAEEYSRRSAAVAAIGEMKEKVVPHLIHELKQRDSRLRRRVVRLTARFGREMIAPGNAIRRRTAAAGALADIPEHAVLAVPALIGALADENAAVAAEVERALRRIGEPAIPRILAVLEDGDVNERTAAVRLINDIRTASPEALAALHAAIRNDAATVRREVAVSLQRVGAPEANIHPLLAALEDEEPGVREEAARTLGGFGRQAKTASGTLRDVLRDDHTRVRIAAAEALWEIDGDAREVLPTLVGAMRERAVRWRAVMVISSMGADAEPAIPFLISALRDEAMHRPFRDPPLSALALGRIGEAAWPALIAACESRDENTRVGAALALRDAGEKAGTGERAAMKTLLRDGSTTVRHAAAMALIAMNESDESLIPILQEMLDADDDVLRLAAVDSLKKLSPDLAWQLRNME